MIIYEHPLMTLGANETAPSFFIRIGAGEHRVDVVYGDNVTGTVTPKHTVEPENPDSMNAITVDGEELILTATGSFVIFGPCLVGFIVASLAGGTIKAQSV